MITYTPNFIPNKIFIYGVGGTGSRLVPLIAQFIKTCPWVIEPELVLVDDDVVEEKNLLRQNFIKNDIGKPKAEVLAQRYSKAFDVIIHSVVKRMTTEGDASVLYHRLYGESSSRYDNSPFQYIHIMCVDSVEARKNILKAICSNTYWPRDGSSLIIDSGNENDYGQITVSTNSILYPPYNLEDLINTIPVQYPVDLPLSGIPLNIKFFDSMVPISAGSCADLDQTMAINSLMANTIFGVIQNFYYAKPLHYHRLNVSLSHGTTPEYFNLKYLKELDYEFQGCDLRIALVKLNSINTYDLELGINNLIYSLKEQGYKNRTLSTSEVSEIDTSEVPEIDTSNLF